jgi:hypothetical protein
MIGLGVGDRVRLSKLEVWFFNGIADDEAEFLRSCIGTETAIVSFDVYGHAELEFAVPKSKDSHYRIHTIWVGQSWIEKV